MEGEQLEIRGARLWLGEDGIFRFIHVPGSVLALEDAREIMAGYLQLYEGKRRPALIDMRNLKSFDREARKYFAGEEARQTVRAQAIVVGSPVSRVLGNFYLGLSPPQTPIRLFTSEDEALEWLKGYLE
jgi:hypothetical protein